VQNHFGKVQEWCVRVSNSTKFYRRCYTIAYPIFCTLFRIKIFGRENINEGAAMICANHSSMFDPVFIGLALGKNDQPLYIAKAELFNIPVLAWLLRGLGATGVDRTKADISIVKKSLSKLKAGAKVVIFPEGTRVAEDGDNSVKHGAIKIAERADAYILPVYIPRKKPIFSKVRIVIGKPYKIIKQKTKRTYDDYELLSNELMSKIQKLKDFATTL